MLSEKIASAVTALSELAGEVDERTWQKLSCIRQELIDAAEVAKNLEEGTLNVQILTSPHGFSRGEKSVSLKYKCFA